MKHPAEVTYLAILIFIGSAIGFICRFNNLSDYALIGVFILSVLFSCIHLYKNRPEWILYPEVDSIILDERTYRLEAWRLWKKNTYIRMIFMVLSCSLTYLLGHIIREYIESLSIEQVFGDKLVLFMVIIISTLLLICVIVFLRKEKILYEQDLWTKSYILEKYEERMLREEFMDDSYLE
jgi:hypothetical protein